jgi:hypothetical protein
VKIPCFERASDKPVTDQAGPPVSSLTLATT